MTDSSATQTSNGFWTGCNNSAATVPRWDSTDENLLLAKLLTAVKGHDFNLAVSGSQLPMFGKQVLTTARDLAGAFVALKHGNFSTVAKILKLYSPRHPTAFQNLRFQTKSVADRWLELRYGWVPALQDIHGAAQALALYYNPPRSAIIRVQKSRITFMDNSINPTAWTVPARLKETHKIIYVLKERLPQHRSLGLADPLSVGWELLPFSFIADWFIPIGTYLANLNQIPQLDGIAYRVTFEKTIAAFGKVIDSFYGTGGSGHMINVHYERLPPTSSLSVPFPSFKGIETALSLGHVQNAIALLASTFLRS
jgi:hypothetical protein